MMSIIVTTSSWILILCGSFLCFTGAVGLLRFPDFFTRMHAAGVTDTLATAMLLGGLLLQTESWLVMVKLILILLFTLLTSPTASHALAKAAIHGGVEPGRKHSAESQGA